MDLKFKKMRTTLKTENLKLKNRNKANLKMSRQINHGNEQTNRSPSQVSLDDLSRRRLLHPQLLQKYG